MNTLPLHVFKRHTQGVLSIWSSCDERRRSAPFRSSSVSRTTTWMQALKYLTDTLRFHVVVLEVCFVGFLTFQSKHWFNVIHKKFPLTLVVNYSVCLDESGNTRNRFVRKTIWRDTLRNSRSLYVTFARI